MSLDPRHYDIIVSPVITEKATALSDQNKVVFKVKSDATETQIRTSLTQRCSRRCIGRNTGCSGSLR